MLPLVSVIIPVYNAEKWIKKTICSVASQKYPRHRIEIIIIDDGSSDKSFQIAKKVTERRFIHLKVVQQKNHGVSAARNYGLRLASGSWIQFLDADDLLHPNKIMHQVKAVAQNRGNHIIYSPWSRIENTSNNKWIKQELRKPRIDHNNIISLIEDKNFIATGSQLMLRQCLIDTGGYDETRSCLEDTQLHIRLYKKGYKFLMADYKTALFFYRNHAGNTSSKSTSLFLHGIYKNIKEININVKKPITPSAKAMLSKVYEQILTGARLIDPKLFQKAYIELKLVKPDWTPSRNTAFKLVTKLFGYANAELLACAYHQVMRQLSRL